METQPLEDPITTDTESIIQAIIPYVDGRDAVAQHKSQYLSFRACGFSVRESIHLSDTSERSLRRWREDDEEFRKADGENLPELRRQAKHEILDIEYTRNFRLVLIKDHDVFRKSIEAPNEMSPEEHSYLIKARQHYTPQQLAIIHQLQASEAGTGQDSGPFSFSQFLIMIAAKTKQGNILQAGVVYNETSSDVEA